MKLVKCCSDTAENIITISSAHWLYIAITKGGKRSLRKKTLANQLALIPEARVVSCIITGGKGREFFLGSKV